jgi:hypothetical protein
MTGVKGLVIDAVLPSSPNFLFFFFKQTKYLGRKYVNFFSYLGWDKLSLSDVSEHANTVTENPL